MVLELRDKLPARGALTETAVPAKSAVEDDVLSALMNLGYQRANAEKALAVVARGGSPESFEAAFKAAMAILSK
jgi:Holliday junction DNA helicase RuvA